MIKAILLGLAVGCDALVCAFSYGAKKMKLPFWSALTVSFLGTIMLCFSLALADIVEDFLSQNIISAIVGTALIVLGLASALLAVFRIHLKTHSKLYVKKVFGITVRLGFSVHDETPKVLASLKESVALGFALSLDSLTTGLAVGMTMSAPEMLVALAFAFVGGLVLQMVGVKLGAHLAAKTTADLSFISGLVLLALGVITVTKW